MTVKFAVPVLNETTAKISETFGTTETSETAKYCLMLDLIFWLFQCKKFGETSKENQAISGTVYET